MCSPHNQDGDKSSAVVHQRIDHLNRLAWDLSDTDSKQAYALSEEAFALASSPQDGDETGAAIDQAGIAFSLRTQGYLNQRFGNYPLGLSQLAQALAIFESLGRADGLPDVYDGLAGIYAQIGSYPESLDYMHKQLAAAEHIGDQRRVANAYNNLAHIYTEMGQHQRAIETLHRNLELAAATGYARIACLSHLNLAQLYIMTGDYALAQEHGLAGLRQSQAAAFEVFEVYGFEILGTLCLQQGDAGAAIHYLDQALAASHALHSPVTEVRILLELGRAYRAAHRLDRAQAFLQQGLTVAGAIDARNELFNTHLLLSEVYEELGDAAQALAHFKRYHEFHELVAGEKANQRLQVLQVAHDTALAQKEAAQLRGLNERLEQEVANRTAEIQQLVATLERRVAASTEELAAFFDLTLLAGQAGELGDVFAQALPRILEVTQSRALCIHLLDPAQASLRLAGHQNLADDVLASLQVVPLAAAFQRWLQQPNDPLLTTDLPAAALLPAAFRLGGCQTYLGAQIKIGGRIEGFLSCYRFTDRGYGIDEIALVTALAQQIGMMLAAPQLRRHTEEVAVLAERQRLARDLHDSVTQSLYSLTLFSRAGREAAADGDTVRLQESLREVEHNTLHALREMRLLLYELRPADLEREGLQRALELRLNTVERRAGLQLDLQLAGLPGLPPQYEVDLYHIVVEALNNVIKHAAARRLAVTLAAAEGRLQLVIADDGCGFDPEQTTGGLGLSNIRERVARLHGRLTVASTPGHGTRLEAVIPYPTENQ